MAAFVPTSSDVVPTDFSLVKWATCGETSGIAAGQLIAFFSTASNRAFLAEGGTTTVTPTPTFYQGDVEGIAVASANRLQQIPYVTGGLLTLGVALMQKIGSQLYLSSSLRGALEVSSLVQQGARAVPVCVVQSPTLVRLNITATTAVATALGV